MNLNFTELLPVFQPIAIRTALMATIPNQKQ